MNHRQESKMTTTVLGIDLGKRWFHVVGRDTAGHVTVRQKFNRAQLIAFISTVSVGSRPLET